MSSTPHLPAAFDWDQAWMQHRDCLPHLRQENALYFVTFRLADSLPESRLRELRAARTLWLLHNAKPHTPEQESEYRGIWTAPIERLLDAGHGDCTLRHPECRQCLQRTMIHDDAKIYSLSDFIIMPNHVHLLVHVPDAHRFSEIIQAWKSISARQINRLVGRKGTLWQPESFDHIVRSQVHWHRFVRYIHNNPLHLPNESYTLGCGSLAAPPPEPASPPPPVP